jgi:hypothetical protein
MAPRYIITSVTFEGTSHARAGRLTVPKPIARSLGSGDDMPIGLRVEARGGVAFDGLIRLGSGTEAYPQFPASVRKSP